MSGGSRQENIVVENSTIEVTAKQPSVKQHRQLGMLAGKMNDSAVLRDNQINNVNIIIQGSGIDVGMLAGQALDRATIDSNQVENCKVCLSGFGSSKKSIGIKTMAETNINIGLIAGKMVGNEHNNVVVKNSTLIHNRIESSQDVWAANIGGVAGRADFARIEDTQAHSQNKIHYHSIIIDGRIAVVVADARHCTILDTTTRDNHLQATVNSFLPAHVGIVTADCHNSTIKHTLDIGSDLDLSQSSLRKDSAGGHVAVAAAVAEGCSIHNTTARETIIDAETNKSSVAIAVAFNDANTTVHRTTAVDCGLFAWEKNTNHYTGSAAVGVAAGRQDNFGRISDTRACGSAIKGYRAGIAAGDPRRNFSGTVACNTELTSSADGISTTLNLACDNASCPATDRADIATVAPSDRIPATIKHSSSTEIPSRQNGSSLSVAAGNGTVNSTASALHNNSEEVNVEFPTVLTTGIVAGGMIAGGVTLYALYQWYHGYQQGLKGKALAIYPLTRIKEAISQRFSTATPDTGLELSELVGAGDTSLSS
ncbi:hypothetical protein [Endozoicomonas sp. GU-1]|uniref:hypothetical protein n=1 Tax=Endozoicomonas sp. GU-1 TaxID=3009078 RepID=UPI0022B43DB9|nr:hypothetical protein [Endozoicomonas sp. GU-1]WBA80034.1 hypothetical protein O2T12_16950 [Endozoicomonas sp. GU-1]WBA87608.1 hypothetical protein O3276_06180 [Endozoicomonas sp. GU-1]